jgi:hypothetical protein
MRGLSQSLQILWCCGPTRACSGRRSPPRSSPPRRKTLVRLRHVSRFPIETAADVSWDSRMNKVQSGVEIAVHDGTTGLTPYKGLDFDFDAWPIDLTVPASDAPDWLLQLQAELDERGAAMITQSQLERAETNGALSSELPDPWAWPSMDQTLRVLSAVAQARLVAWLECGGSYAFVWASRKAAD